MEEEIRHKILDFLESTIEKQREEFANLPVCPFAKAERTSGRLQLDYFNVASQDICGLVSNMINAGYESGLYVVKENDEFVELNGDRDTIRFANFLKKELKSGGLKDYTIICFNPNDTVSAGEYNVRSEFPYLMINVAKTNVIHDSQKNLQKTKYYDKFTKQYKKMLGIK